MDDGVGIGAVLSISGEQAIRQQEEFFDNERKTIGFNVSIVPRRISIIVCDSNGSVVVDNKTLTDRVLFLGRARQNMLSFTGKDRNE